VNWTVETARVKQLHGFKREAGDALELALEIGAFDDISPEIQSVLNP
jgi:hypothetical protein